TVIARDEADERPGEHRRHHGDDADRQRDLAAIEKTAQRIATELVGAERKREMGEWREEADRGVELNWIVRREGWGEEGGEAEEHDGDSAHERRAMPGETAKEAL